MSEYTPTDQQVEDSFAYDPEYEYRHPDDPGYHYRNRAAYKRWLSQHDRLVAERTWDECLAEIEENEINTQQAREGNPYRKEQENTNA